MAANYSLASAATARPPHVYSLLLVSPALLVMIKSMSILRLRLHLLPTTVVFSPVPLRYCMAPGGIVQLAPLWIIHQPHKQSLGHRKWRIHCIVTWLAAILAPETRHFIRLCRLYEKQRLLRWLIINTNRKSGFLSWFTICHHIRDRK